jgi:two-component system cell cycle sensor histidine kinase/response regulator CckA
MSPPIPPAPLDAFTDALPEHALLRIVTENARVGLVVVDRHRRYVYANRTYAEILGLSSSSLVGLRLEHVLTEVYDAQVRPRLDRAFAGERVHYDLRMPSPGGDRYYAVRYEPTEVDGSVALVVVVITEITERWQIQMDASRATAIVEASDDAIIGKDLDGFVTSWNEGAMKIFGYSAAEMVGTSIRKLVPADRQEEETAILEKIRRGERVQHLETQRLTKTGTLITVSVTASPIRDATGRVVGASKVVRDFTELRRADEERQFQQTMLLTERELTLDGILVVDERGKVLSYNGRFGQMWGLSPQELATRADAALLQAAHTKVADPDGFIQRVRHLYERHDASSRDEVELVDGRVFDRYSAPMRTAEGRYYGRVWYFRDVTERKQAIAALRLERDRAQRYLDTAGVILLALDIEGRITLVNRFACAAFGWTAEELLGRDFIDTCVPARLRAQIRHRLGVVQQGDDRVVASEIITRAGDERIVEWRTTFLRDDAGAIVGTFSSGSDITEQRRAEVALREERDRAQRYLDTADVILLALDLEGRITLINRKGCELLGWTETELLGRHWLTTCLPPRSREELGQTFGTLGSDDSSAVETPILTKGGTERLIEWRNRVIRDGEGLAIGSLSSGTDVTDRHKLEQQYHQAQKMEAVGRLAGGVAHDFNNLLTAILGYCQLLLADLDAENPSRADILEIHKAGESAARLTRQLLAFSRKQIIAPELLDLNAVIDQLKGMLGRIIGEDLRIVLNLRPGLAPVLADPGQIDQVVMNLAVNARDAMPQGGTLTIETANVVLDESYASSHFSVVPGPYVALIVSDTGTGMSPETQARLFEPFFTTKERGKGTGLGLATVHGIVMRSGGSVSVYSELGRGTSFTLYFPRAASADMVAEVAPPVVRPHAAGETVLVVEDSDGLRALAKRILERLGYTVLLAANAREAGELFERHPSIDVVLTDVIMPGGSGPELTKVLVAERPGVKVVYMSGYTEDAITHHGVLDPGIAFLHKPFTAETLGAKIQEVLAS